jgi:hypothetical protein
MHALSLSSAVKRISAGCLVLAGCLVVIGPDFVHAREIKLHVVDEHGQLVPKFQVMLLDAENDLVSWTDGADGITTLKNSWEWEPKGAVRIIVRADGYASTLKQFDGAERQKLLGQIGDKF